MTELKLLRSKPADEGIPPEAITAVIEQINRERMGVHSLMLLRHGRVVAEGWWSPCREQLLHMLFSLTKSFTSIAVGFAVQEGILSEEDRVVSFFPDRLPCRPCQYMEKVQIKHLLTHTTGFDKDPMCFKAPIDWPARFLRTYLEHEPGSHFAYTDDGPNLLSAILEKCTGRTLEEYLTPRLFEPLGITEWHWEKSPDGNSVGGADLSLKTEDIAKFGQFLLNGGVWNGKRLLNEEWLRKATSKLVDTSWKTGDWGQGYGYLFWQCVPKGVYRGDGAFGQFCLIFPKQDMVIVLTGGNNAGAEILELLFEKLLPQVRDGAVDGDAEAQAALENSLSGLALPVPVGGSGSPAAESHSGRTYELSPNPLGLTHIRFDFGKETRVFIQAGEESSLLPVGYGEWLDGQIFLRPHDVPPVSPFGLVACAGAWEGDTYHLAIQFPVTSYCCYLDVEFGEAPVLSSHWNVSFAPPSTARMFARPVE